VGGALVRARQYDDELLAAEAGHEVGVVGGGGQRPGDAPQRSVAEQMAIAVVEGLEVVEVDHQDRQPGAAAACRGDAVSNDNIFELCGATVDDAAQGLMPKEPGTYYWQVHRECEAYVCLGGVEVTDVWSVRVKRTVCSVNRGELNKARAQLKAARATLALRRTAGRRARVSRLAARVATLHTRLRVVHGCKDQA
jgi:hypothetical protein